MREALEYRYTDEESDVASGPESRVPAALRPHQERIVAELEAHREHGDRLAAPRIGVIAREAHTFFLQFDRVHDIDWADAVCVLRAVTALDDAQAEALGAHVDERRGDYLLAQRVLSAAEDGDIEHAARLAATMPPERAHYAYRDIGRVAAKRGDSDLYFRFAKQYAAGKDKNMLDRLRTYLVEGVQREHGWAEAVAVAQDKRVGTGHLFPVLILVARSGDLAAVDAALAGPLRGLFGPHLEMNAEMIAIASASPDRPDADHPRLGALLDRVIAIDPTESKQVSQSRDAILFASWPAIGDEATLKRVRAAMRTPNYKREFSALKRDSGVS
jgi:hypothetical protein